MVQWVFQERVRQTRRGGIQTEEVIWDCVVLLANLIFYRAKRSSISFSRMLGYVGLQKQVPRSLLQH